jgi:hypothetical protein
MLLAKKIGIWGGYSGIVGVTMIGISFAINNGPTLNATSEQLATFSSQHYASIMWGSWFQAVGPWLIIIFALAVLYLAEAMNKFAGWLTLFGAGVLMMVSLTEVVFYISALNTNDDRMAIISNDIAHSVQHLYFIVAAPALFFPLGAVILSSSVLPHTWLSCNYPRRSFFYPWHCLSDDPYAIACGNMPCCRSGSLVDSCGNYT